MKTVRLQNGRFIQLSVVVLDSTMEEIIQKVKDLKFNIRSVTSKYDRNGKIYSHRFSVLHQENYVVIRQLENGKVLLLYSSTISQEVGVKVILPIADVVNYLVDFGKKRKSYLPAGDYTESFCTDYTEYTFLLPYVLQKDNEIYLNSFISDPDADSIFNQMTNNEKDEFFFATYDKSGVFYEKRLVPFICTSLMRNKRSHLFEEVFVKKLFDGKFDILEQYASLTQKDYSPYGIPIDLIVYYYGRFDLFQRYGSFHDFVGYEPTIPEDYKVLKSLVPFINQICPGTDSKFHIDMVEKRIVIDHSGSISFDRRKDGEILHVTVIYPSWQNADLVTSIISYENVSEIIFELERDP